MKKVLLVAAMLIIAAPVMATVSVTATDKGSGVVEVSYNCSAAEKVRAFALDITVDNGLVINNIRDFNRGESKVPGGGYGIFPGSFANVINASSPNWADTNYSPIGRTSDPNTRTGLGTGAITVELGTLYVGPNSPGPSGLLFRLDVNGNGAHDGNLLIALNGTRGGIVLEDSNLAPSPVLTGTKVTFCVTIPNIVGLTTTAADACLISNNLTVAKTGQYSCTVAANVVISQDTAGSCVTSGTPVNYTYSLGTISVPNVVGMTRAAAVTALTGFTVGTDVNVPGDGVMAVGNVYAQNPPAGPNCTSTVILSVVSYPIKATSAIYANWVTNGKPACWAYPRQCHGDADGKKAGQNWVTGNDLTILKGALNVSPLPTGGTCADFDHKKAGQNWVTGTDLAILKANLNTAPPMCGDTSTTSDPNFWYWCNPTGGTCPTSPAGQVCATAGTCPNTP